MKNPPKRVGGNLRIISYQYFSQSTVSAPAQYISQFYTAVYYLPGLLQIIIFASQRKRGMLKIVKHTAVWRDPLCFLLVIETLFSLFQKKIYLLNSEKKSHHNA